jgi:hypothetical protein
MPRMCFSYQPDVPQGIGTRAAAPPAPHRMPAGSCFSNMVDVPQPASAGYLSCFSYSLDVTPGAGNGAAAPTAPPGLHRMVNTACFRY